MMMEIDPPTDFPSKDDEIRYWMNVAQHMCDRNKDIERELEEYQENSIYLEKELETSFLESDKKNQTLCRENSKLISNNEELKMKLNEQMCACIQMQNEVENLKLDNNNLLKHIRKLEQENDDLERASRENKVAKEEMETNYLELVEKFAFLETEVEEKNEMQILIQRLKDENTEMKQQIQVDLRERQTVHEGKSVSGKIFNVNIKRFDNECSSDTSKLIHTDEEASDVCKHCKVHSKGITLWRRAHMLSQMAKKKIQENSSAERKSQSKFEKRATLPVIPSDGHLRSSKACAKMRSRSHSFVNEIQEVDDRSPVIRKIESRLKKVKDEEKRQQNLSSFLKRLRRKD